MCAWLVHNVMLSWVIVHFMKLLQVACYDTLIGCNHAMQEEGWMPVTIMWYLNNAVSLYLQFQRPFNFSQFHWNGNCSEKEAYAQLSSVCEVLEYIDTLNELHTDYKNKYSGSRLTQVAALIRVGKQVQTTACDWVSLVHEKCMYVCTCLSDHSVNM